MSEHTDRRGEHFFVGIDPVVGCWVASCACGWSSDLHQGEDRALIAYGRHRAAGAVPFLRPTSSVGSDLPPDVTGS